MAAKTGKRESRRRQTPTTGKPRDREKSAGRAPMRTIARQRDARIGGLREAHLKQPMAVPDAASNRPPRLVEEMLTMQRGLQLSGSPSGVLMERMTVEIHRLAMRLTLRELNALLALPSAWDGLAVLVAISEVAPTMPSPQITALLRRIEIRRALMASVSTLTVPQAATVLRITKQAVRWRIASRRLLAFRDGARYRLPSWQFDRRAHQVHDGVIPLLVAAGNAGLDEWDLQELLAKEMRARGQHTTALAWFASGRTDEVVRLVKAHAARST